MRELTAGAMREQTRSRRWASRGGAQLVVALAGCATILAAGCGNETCFDKACEWTEREWSLLQTLTLTHDPPTDPSNAYVSNPAAAQLGQSFFFDPIFSGVANDRDPLGRAARASLQPEGTPLGISCASCHDPSHAGTDTASPLVNVSVGAGTTDVNATSTFNAGYRKIVFWNGRADSQWGLAVAVAESPTTMNGDRLSLAHALALNYAQPFTAVFADLPANWTIRVFGFPLSGKPGAKPGCQSGDPTEPWGDSYDCLPSADQELATRILVDWAKAIAAYEQKLISRRAPFDDFVAGGPDSRVLSPEARLGARLFVGKAACMNCHSGPLLSDDDFHNVGAPQTGPGVPTPADCGAGNASCDCINGVKCLPWGAFDGLTKLRASKWLHSSEWSDDPNDAVALSYVTRPITDDLKGAWRTPSLRDVALTAPYMHDGALATLDDVMRHYNSGGAAGAGTAVGHKSPGIAPLDLTDEEINALLVFLTSLTGTPPDSALLRAP